MKVGFIGLGKLGWPVAEVLAEHHQVRGYDVERRSPAGVEIVDDVGEAVADTDLTFVAVPTPHAADYAGDRPTAELPPQDFDYSTLCEVVQAAGKAQGNDHLLVVISTVLPGTTRRELAPLATADQLIYSPSFIAMGSVKADFRSPEFVAIGSHDGRHSDRLLDCYRPVHGHGQTIRIGTWEEVEAIKVFYNTYISFKLAFVNMVQDVAEHLGHMNVDVVTRALSGATERLVSDRYMRAGMGDGGSCHPRDNIALRQLSQQLDLPYDLFGAIVAARDGQARLMADFLLEQTSRLGHDRIVILGRSFKPSVDDPTGSPSVLVGSYVEAAGVELRYDGDFDGPAVYLLAHPDRFHDWSFPDGSIVVDAYRSSPAIPGCQMIHYGDTRERTPQASRRPS